MHAIGRDHVPGTIHLVDMDAGHHSGTDDIILNPQPSADPEDPLNWTYRRKLFHAAMVYTYLLGLGIATTVQYSILTNISEETGIPLAHINTGIGLMFLFGGWGCLLWQPIALTYGRRGVYILSSLLCLIPMVLTAYTTSSAAWYAHRILIGLFLAPAESLPELSIPDIFFAHERGSFLSIYTLLLFGSNALAPFFAGFINHSMGWRAAIWFGTIMLATTTVIIFFGMEETMYFRKAVEGDTETLEAASDDLEGKNGEKISATVSLATVSRPPTLIPVPANQKRTYFQKLALFRRDEGSPAVKQLFVMMVRPLLIIFYFPNVTYAGFLYGSNLCMYQVQNATMALILGGIPYNFSSNMVGTSYLSLVVGCVLAWLWVGWTGDKAAVFFARRNKGVREPEHRLWILVVSGIIGTSGMILWGVGAANQVHFMGLMVGMAMVSFAIVCGSASAIAYDVDCFKDIAGETLISVMVIRNTMGFGMSYGITPWLESSGLEHTFIAVAFLFLACTATFLLFIVFGKRLRKFSSKKYWEYVDTLIVSH